MDNSLQTPVNSFDNCKSKDAHKTTQLKTIFNYLQNHIATNTMVSNATGVSQKNICRFKRDLEQMGLLVEVKKEYCKATNHLAWYLSTNPKHFPPSNQLKLWN